MASKTRYPTPTTPSKTRIGWIGIGVMGSSMATRLINAGYSLTIYARTPSKATSLLSLGAQLANSPTQLAQSSDIVFTMLGHPSDVRQIVFESDHSVLNGFRPNGVLVDHTSSDPKLAREIFALARDKGCWAIDAPVSGGDLGAKNGELSIFCGGDENVVEWIRPVLEIMGSKVSYMGGAGSGMSCKIGNQIVVGANLLGLSEGLVFAGRAGLDKDGWMDAIKDGAAGSKVMELFGKRMIERDFRPGGFAEYMVKDMGMGVNYGVDVEEDEGVVVLPGAALTKQLFASMVANGDGKLGTQGLVSVIERINGI